MDRLQAQKLTLIIFVSFSFVSCGGGTASKTATAPVASGLDTTSEYEKISSTEQTSAKLPQQGDFKEEVQTLTVNAPAGVGATNTTNPGSCIYNLERQRHVVMATTSTFEESVTSSAALLEGSAPHCPAVPSGFAASETKTYQHSDLKNQKLQDLKSFLDPSTYSKSGAKKIQFSVSKNETYTLGGLDIPVHHVSLDLQSADGKVRTLHYYLALNSWYLGKILTQETEANGNLTADYTVVSFHSGGNNQTN